MSCVLAGSAEFRESDVGQAWVRRQLSRGDIFVTRSKTPYELDWKSPVGEELDFIIIHLAVDQFLAALEAVYPGKADEVEIIDFFGRDEALAHLCFACGDVSLQSVFHKAQHMRWRLDNRRAVSLQIEVADSVNGLGVSREQQCPGVHQIFPDHDLLRRFRAEGPQPFTGSDLTHSHQVGGVDFDSSIELLKLQEPLGCVADWVAVFELEVAEARLKSLCTEPSMRVGLLRASYLRHAENSNKTTKSSKDSF